MGHRIAVAVRSDRWAGALLLGAWLSVTAVWPAGLVPVGKTQLMWQPLLLLTLTILVLSRGRREGWGLAIGRSLWMFVVFTLAAWLPSLHDLPTSLRSHPTFYHGYLLVYEGGLAMFVGWQAALAASRTSDSWWTSNGWSRPLVVAPVLLVLRGLQAGHWAAALVGVFLGVSVAALWQSQRWGVRRSSRFWRLVPVGLFIGATLLVWGSSLRIYALTGPSEPGTQAGFPSASDDGPAYYSLGLRISKDPRLLFTPELGDQVFFTGYSVLMGLWFRLVGGPHVPSWLLWHGVAGGLLAVAVYWIGRKLTGQAILGVVAGVLVVADHVMLQLLSTMNQETFFFALVYWALLLWSQAADSPAARPRLALLAGLLLGVSVVCRTISLLIPLVWYLGMSWERSRAGISPARKQGGLLLLGCAIPVALMMIRHRIAWGYWTVAGAHAQEHVVGWNYALRLHDVHLTDVGLAGWLRMLVAEPHLLWQHVIPSWWAQGVYLWTHRGFGQMDLVQGLNHPGSYQAALTTILTVSALVGAVVAIRRRTRLNVALLSLPLYFTSFVLLYYVLNSRYRSPFIPALYLLSCLGLSLPWMAARSRDPAAGHAPAPGMSERELLGATR